MEAKFPKLESGGTTVDTIDLLAERRSRRQNDREKRKKEFQSSSIKKDTLMITPDLSACEDQEDTLVTMSPDQILKRSFETVTPPGIGLPHKSQSGVSSLERAFQRNLEKKGQHKSSDDKDNDGLKSSEVSEVSALPDWVRNHPDFKRCVAKPLDLKDSKHRANQLRKALRLPPEERPLSSVLLVAQWLVEFTDIDLEGVPRRNLMAMARALYMRRLKRRGKAVYLSGESPTNVYIVMDGVAIQDSSLSQYGRTQVDSNGTLLGPGRTFGLVSPLTIDEPRNDSVFNDCFPWDMEMTSSQTEIQTSENETSENKNNIILASSDEAGRITSTNKNKAPSLLLAVIPLSTFFEEAAPGLSIRAESYRPYISEHLSPSRNWLDSKHFVFARQLRTRTLMPGDVVWRRGQPADSLAIVLDGNFVITREVTWSITNMWPEDNEPNSKRRSRVREDGTTMVLETISNVFGSGDNQSKSNSSGGGGLKKLNRKSTQVIGMNPENEIDPTVKVIVGEEPLLLVREDPNGIKHSFEETRKYTLRAAGPGLCTLLELPRSAVRRYLPFRGPWAASVAKQAASRLISDEGVALAHRQRVAYESASRTEWGEKMLAREKQSLKHQLLADRRLQHASKISSEEHAKIHSHLLAHTGKLMKDEWAERAASLKQIPRSLQGNWGQGLEAPLPMLVAGNPVIQRG
mmetsp:Transcript_13757/g.16376  ORF Transcript_13757/g.16376 Transcript_13757/m.16376 type:complete len:689 (-) Transcript_13757:145-2211(-)|eukprot:CAMPEP_0114343384 /NCGR_PEP_ID=MMETSP0101-20121206/10562_1 /TAXON_ID=38822 ORGANISM="Pteridomonas danica, Strain PT" /NCGR_SAMPLE_ID=MMETSP0101 /ASSEMBLY_ACC=CAM_ASM_000211 /LENGTH=688 /DNA_ID=CAMNT_0001478071 /DNA_START=53 /DNA_END=2119 /DNA_ORIENTATION=+